MKKLRVGEAITIKAGAKINFFGDEILNTGCFSIESGTLLKDVRVFSGSNTEVENIETVEIDAKNVYRKMLKK